MHTTDWHLIEYSYDRDSKTGAEREEFVYEREFHHNGTVTAELARRMRQGVNGKDIDERTMINHFTAEIH